MLGTFASPPASFQAEICRELSALFRSESNNLLAMHDNFSGAMNGSRCRAAR